MSKKLIEMREKQANLATQARAEMDKVTDDTPEAEAAEAERRFDAMMSDYDKLQEKIDREERLEDAERRAAEPRRPLDDRIDEAERREAAPEYREVFEKQLRYGAASLDAEEREVLMANYRSTELRAQGTSPDAAGGYVVPEVFSDEINKSMAIWGPMFDANVTREIRTSGGNPIPWPTVDDTANETTQKAQNVAADDDGSDDVAFGQKLLEAYTHTTGVVRVSNELLEDSAFDMQSLLTDLFGERAGRGANRALTTGTGSSQPHGIVTASSLGKTAAAAASITSDELIDLLHSVDAAYRQSPRTIWQFNDLTLAAIRKLKDGQGNYLWQMGDVRIGEPATLLGHAYRVNNAMADIGASARPVIFGDHNRYVVRKVRNFMVMALRERYAEFFQTGMIGFNRFDGELVDTAAVKHLVMAAS